MAGSASINEPTDRDVNTVLLVGHFGGGRPAMREKLNTEN